MGFPGGTTSQDGVSATDSTPNDHAPAYCLWYKEIHLIQAFIFFFYLPQLFSFSHIENEGSNSLSSNGYNCPQCGSRYCELPVECKQCGLTLVSAPHLARSYHHLFPIKPFIERSYTSDNSFCFGCVKSLTEAEPNVSVVNFTENLPQSCLLIQIMQVYECENCQHIFCLDCDLFVRETLHTCPGCASDANKAHMNTK